MLYRPTLGEFGVLVGRWEIFCVEITIGTIEFLHYEWLVGIPTANRFRPEK